MNEFDDMDQGAEGVELPDASLGDDLDLVGRGGGGNKMLTPIIILVILLLEAVGSHFIVKKMLFSKPRVAKVRKEEKTEKAAMGQVFSLTSVIINPKGSRGNRVLLLDIGFEVPDLKIVEELGVIEPKLRDNIITFLGSQDQKVLSDIEWRERIRERIKEIANFHLSSGEVDKVYFIRYVFQ